MRFAGGLLGLGVGGYFYYQAHLLAPLRIGVKDAQTDLVEIEYYGRGGIRAVPFVNSAFKLTGLQGGQPPQTYFGGIFKECNARWWIDKTLFTEEDLGASQKKEDKKNIRGIVELDARATVEEDVYGLVDSLMGTTVIMSIRRDGPAQGAATGFLEVDWVGELVPGQRYKLSAECTNMKGRDYFPTAQLTDKDGKVVRRYRSRFVKVEWPLAINIENLIALKFIYHKHIEQK